MGRAGVGGQWKARRRLRCRPVLLLLAACIALAATGFLVAATTGGGGSPVTSAADHVATTSTDASPTTTTTAPTTTTTAPSPATTDPGGLPQTSALPTTTSPAFTANMAALWDGVSTGLPEEAVPGFFPESAYVQLKTVPSARSDFTGRLVAEYEEDVTAAHQLLGPGAPMAKLVGVEVDAAYAHWVPMGTCYNDVGYFEVPNSRVVYSINGQVSSFGIASMISWRGEWYIVHLGAILRSGSGGEVDDPSAGPGTPTYSSTC
ncbi:MAG TPA: hypothetical protein VMV06_07780 [Acidimicrobiales bacterium]|nr:hypothetical protein [Acidimicrobiales bacterium]